jgi:hypothetical protein
MGMLLNKAIECALVLSWADLIKVVPLVSARVEYRRESGHLLDHLTVWADKGKGYRDRVCDYRTEDSSEDPKGVQFWRGHHSDQLAQALGFILHNQDHFTFSPTVRYGLVLVFPPGDAERTEAANWEGPVPGRPDVANGTSRDDRLTA